MIKYIYLVFTQTLQGQPHEEDEECAAGTDQQSRLKAVALRQPSSQRGRTNCSQDLRGDGCQANGRCGVSRRNPLRGDPHHAQSGKRLAAGEYKSNRDQRRFTRSGTLTIRLASQLQESCRSLQSLHHRVQGTASKRALLIGCAHSSQMPNFSCRIRAKASSMARKSLPSV